MAGNGRPDKGDTPGVIAPPPLIFLGGLALGLALDPLIGIAGTGLPSAMRVFVGILLLAGAAALIASALLRFRRAGTRPEPWQPATAFVAGGPYRFTRNPMYLGMAAAALALAFLADSPGALLALIPTLAVIHHGVIRREERYLEARFGDAYRQYRTAVRRWL